MPNPLRIRQSWPAAARAENVAIWRAARHGDEEKLYALVEDSLDDVGRDRGSWVHMRRLNWLHDRKGTSPLMAAASHRRGAAAVGVLLDEQCVDVNAVDATQQLNTALHYAASHSADAAAVELLLRHGADPFRLNRRGHTPLDEARVHGRKLAARALLERMAVHADWLYVRGQFRWRKCWGVLLACDAARTATELCIYASPEHVRPEAVVLVEERSSVFPFASTDSFRWLRHPFAFTTSKPVMWQSVRKQQFSRAPECKKTMTHEHADARHVVFAAEGKASLDMWIRMLSPAPRTDATQLNTRRENGESYYWPLENLESGSAQIQRIQSGSPDAAIFEPPIPSRGRSATAPAPPLPPPLTTMTSPPSSPRSSGDLRLRNRRALARRSRAVSAPSGQPAQSESRVTRTRPLPSAASRVERTSSEATDDVSSVSSTERADEQEPADSAQDVRSEDHLGAQERSSDRASSVDQERAEQDLGGAGASSSAEGQGDSGEQPAASTPSDRHDGTEQEQSAAITPSSTEDQGGVTEQHASSASSNTRSQGDTSEAAADQESGQATTAAVTDSGREPRRPRDLCMICVSVPRDTACVPCGHVAACHACLLTAVQTYRVCPICRARVQTIMRIYDA